MIEILLSVAARFFWIVSRNVLLSRALFAIVVLLAKLEWQLEYTSVVSLTFSTALALLRKATFAAKMFESAFDFLIKL